MHLCSTKNRTTLLRFTVVAYIPRVNVIRLRIVSGSDFWMDDLCGYNKVAARCGKRKSGGGEMKIEHMAMQVADVAGMTTWYCENLGFTVKRASDDPKPVRFLADETGQVMIEVYRDPNTEIPDYGNMHPLVLHLAFVCEDVDLKAKKLTAAGAALLEKEQTPVGDTLAMLRDPWGFCIQLCQRAEPMV